MKRFIVTGGAGFVGANLTDMLIQEGYAVTIVDNLCTGLEENINKKADFIRSDLSKPDFVKKLPHKDVTGVFHIAAQSSGEISFDNPYYDLQVNVASVLLLLDWCRRRDVRRFFFTSSMAVYGECESQKLSEESACRPRSFYGIGKLAAENYIRFYSNHAGIGYTIFRLFNAYGPKQNIHNLRQGMASIYMAYVLREEPILVKGSLDRFRDQTYIGDAADLMMLCLEKVASINQIYNVGTGRKTTVRELIDTILRVSGRPKTYPIEMGPPTAGDLFGSYADVSKAGRELGWSSRWTLEDGLREMYKYYTREKWQGEKTKTLT